MSNRANVGCGATPTEGWLNFDNSISVRLAGWTLLLSILKSLGLASQDALKFAAIVRLKGVVWADASRRIPVQSESLDVVYSSHMLEHLDPREAECFLNEIRRVLKPGGIIRLVVPDLRDRKSTRL